MATEAHRRANHKWYLKNKDKHAESVNKYREKLKETNPEKLEEWSKNGSVAQLKRDTCEILTKHADDLADDPERLTTEFITGLIGTGEMEEE